MTVQEIILQSKRGETLIYLGDNIKVFRTIVVAIGMTELKADTMVEQIRDAQRNGKEIEIVVRTCCGELDGWNYVDSIDFYGIDLENLYCSRWRCDRVIDARSCKICGAKVV